jgi:hypothetical protein
VGVARGWITLGRSMIKAAKAEVEQIERQICRLSSTPNNNLGATPSSLPP